MGKFSVRTSPPLGHPARPKAQPARPDWMAQRGERTDIRTDGRKISPFYRTSSSIGAAALPPPMKTKEKAEQGKGTADHLMPLGYLFEPQVCPIWAPKCHLLALSWPIEPQIDLLETQASCWSNLAPCWSFWAPRYLCKQQPIIYFHNHHLKKAITSKRIKLEIPGLSGFVGLEKFFPMVM